MNQFEKYVEADEFQVRGATLLLEEFSDEIAKMHGTCLDIGCGPGKVAAQLVLPKLPKDARLVGCDISKDAIRLARLRNAKEKRLSFFELDIGTSKLPPQLFGTFDNAISTYCIHWCSDPGQVFENIYNLLRPNGKALVIFVTSYFSVSTYPKLYAYPEYQPYMKDYKIYQPYFHNCDNSREQLKNLMQDIGFQVLHCSYRDNTHTFKNLESAKQHVMSLEPFFNRMPKELQKKYEKDIINELLDTNYFYVASKDKINKSSIDNHTLMSKINTLTAYIHKPV